MLPRIVLFFLQLLVAWYTADLFAMPIVRGLGLTRTYDVLVYAVVLALLVMIVGWAGSLVLKDLTQPSGATLLVCLALALLLAGLTLIPQAQQALESAVPAFRDPNNRRFIPLLGALVGYLVKR